MRILYNTQANTGEEMVNVELLKEEGRCALILSDGESTINAIAAACSTSGIHAAMVLSGIGMMREMKIGYWNGNEYEIKE
ncbi:MAG: DUF296 domain-containing protein, partial [Methanomassiliicoccales archaeon]